MRYFMSRTEFMSFLLNKNKNKMDLKKINGALCVLVEKRFFMSFFIGGDLLFCAFYFIAYCVSLSVYEDNWMWVLFLGVTRLEGIICVSALGTAIRVKSQNKIPLYYCKIHGLSLTYYSFWVSFIIILFFPIPVRMFYYGSAWMIFCGLFVWFIFVLSRTPLFLVIRAMHRNSETVQDFRAENVEDMISVTEGSSQNEDVDFFS